MLGEETERFVQNVAVKECGSTVPVPCETKTLPQPAVKCDLSSLDFRLVVVVVLVWMASDGTSLFRALWQASRSSQPNSRPHA